MNVKALQQTIKATLWGMNKPKLKRVWDNKQKKYVIVDKKGKEVEADEVTIYSPNYSPTEEKGND